MKHVRDAKVVPGIHSDHSAVKLHLRLRTRIKPHIRITERINWAQLREDDTNQEYNAIIGTVFTHRLLDAADMSYTTAAAEIIDAATAVATEKVSSSSGWFEPARSILTPLFETRGKVLDQCRHASPAAKPDLISRCRLLRQECREAVDTAKAQYASTLAAEIHGMRLNPRQAWEAIKTLKRGILGHHAPITPLCFKRPDGSTTSTDHDHLEVLQSHFNRVFNNRQSIDWSALDEVTQRKTRHDIGGPLTPAEFDAALRSLDNHKAPGLNGLTIEAIKALDTSNRSVLFNIVDRFFEGEIDIDEWHWGNLRALPKKGDLSNPNNWRGINLLDVTSKIVSKLVTRRLQTVLFDEGTPFQFGSTPGTGCPDAVFSLKTILQSRREVDLDSWVVYVDLVKAFDTANHALLTALLRKMGIPDKVVRVVRSLVFARHAGHA